MLFYVVLNLFFTRHLIKLSNIHWLSGCWVLVGFPKQLNLNSRIVMLGAFTFGLRIKTLFQKKKDSTLVTNKKPRIRYRIFTIYIPGIS